MNVEIRSEALRDIAEGVAFYDRKDMVQATTFFNEFSRISSYSAELPVFTKPISAITEE